MKKKVLIIVGVIIFVLVFAITVLTIINIQKQKEAQVKQQEQNLLKEISSHYNKYVVTNKEASLYKKVDNDYEEYGKINSEVNLKLSDMEIKYQTKYFYIEDLNLYITYSDVEPTDIYEKDDRYKNYIPFNLNIKTNDITKFYDIDGNHVYTINKSFDFEVLVNKNDSYGVVYNDELLFINKEDTKEVYESKNTDLKNKNRIKTLTYHFLYNTEKYNCNQIICQSLEQFESHLKYLRENDFFTLKLYELEMYMNGEIQIPQKSIVLTIDDGTIFDPDAVKLLEKYDVDATLFVITSWVDATGFRSKNLDLESHTHNMHNQYECPGYGSQGGGILCLDEEYVLNDLKISQEKLGGSKYFAYPFYDFNDRAISLLKKAGFKLAFIGQYDTDGYSYPNVTDNYKLRRTTLLSSTSMEEFISFLK